MFWRAGVLAGWWTSGLVGWRDSETSVVYQRTADFPNKKAFPFGSAFLMGQSISNTTVTCPCIFDSPASMGVAASFSALAAASFTFIMR